MYIIITEDSTGKIIRKIDVSEKSEGQRDRAWIGFLIKTDLSKFSVDLITKKEILYRVFHGLDTSPNDQNKTNATKTKPTQRSDN